MIRKSGPDSFRALVNQAEDFFDFQIGRKLSAAEADTTAGRVAFARKISHFIGLVPDPIVRDTLISRLAVRLIIPRETLQQMARLPAKQAAGKTTIAEDVATPQISLPRHDLALICKAVLVDPGLLKEIQQQPWSLILQHVEGAELLSKIFGSELDPREPSSIAALFASLQNSEASVLSLILANRELNEHMGHLFWTRLAAAELQRRKRQIETILRLAADDSGIQKQAQRELKEVLDLESSFTDISRLASRA
jgi:DNA primase